MWTVSEFQVKFIWKEHEWFGQMACKFSKICSQENFSWEAHAVLSWTALGKLSPRVLHRIILDVVIVLNCADINQCHANTGCSLPYAEPADLSSAASDPISNKHATVAIHTWH